MIPRLAWTKPPADRSAAVQALSKVIEHGTDELKSLAAYDLRRVSHPTDASTLSALAAPDSPEQKARLIRRIGNAWCPENVVIAIAQYLDSPDPQLRAAAADALRECPEAFQTGHLERAISAEPDEGVRRHMQAALERWRWLERIGRGWRPNPS